MPWISAISTANSLNKSQAVWDSLNLSAQLKYMAHRNSPSSLWDPPTLCGTYHSVVGPTISLWDPPYVVVCLLML
jgi:hypothetical protein